MSDITAFPHRYTVALSQGLLSAPPRSPIVAGAPPQFGGSDRVWSPEELVVGAALLCLQTTFDAFARRASLTVVGWRGTGTGVLEKTAAGPAFTAIEIVVEIDVPAGAEEQARKLLASAERHCIVARALRAPVEVHASFKGVAAGASAA
jgi:organic hydroperoxide reductase OsmC/OhrA